ncbi:MAG: hypothetical protein MUE81_01845, partial [Thermoflexibacter sp.]|nr:hypothetical protein [Thermoflexibacter sp.]
MEISNKENNSSEKYEEYVKAIQQYFIDKEDDSKSKEARKKFRDAITSIFSEDINKKFEKWFRYDDVEDSIKKLLAIKPNHLLYGQIHDLQEGIKKIFPNYSHKSPLNLILDIVFYSFKVQKILPTYHHPLQIENRNDILINEKTKEYLSEKNIILEEFSFSEQFINNNIKDIYHFTNEIKELDYESNSYIIDARRIVENEEDTAQKRFPIIKLPESKLNNLFDSKNNIKWIDYIKIQLRDIYEYDDEKIDTIFSKFDTQALYKQLVLEFWKRNGIDIKDDKEKQEHLIDTFDTFAFELIQNPAYKVKHLYCVPIMVYADKIKTGAALFIMSDFYIRLFRVSIVQYYMSRLFGPAFHTELQEIASEAEINAEAISIISRNISHNIGSHVLSYLKDIFRSTENILE